MEEVYFAGELWIFAPLSVMEMEKVSDSPLPTILQ